MKADDPRHGTARGYDLKCRCAPCKAAKSKLNAARPRRPRVVVDANALTGGEWVPVDGIMRWVSA